MLAEVPEALGRLAALQQLVLSGNQLTALPSGISALGARCPYPRCFSGRACTGLAATASMLQAGLDNMTQLGMLTQLVPG